MGFVPPTPPGIATTADLAALAAQLGQGPQFVATAAMTVQEALANYPAGAAYRGKYVRVTNLYGWIDGVMRCGMDSGSGIYFWQPTTPEYGRSMPVTGDMTLMRLLSPVSVVLTGSIAVGVTRQVTIDLANARPGETIELKNGIGSLLGSLNIAASGIGTIVGLAIGNYVKFVVDASSGSLSLVRLV